MGAPITLPIRVIVAAGDTFRHIVSDGLSQSREIVLAGEANDLSALYAVLDNVKAHLVLLDADHFGVATLDAVHQLGRIAPTCRILIVADDESDNLAMNALREGAHGHATKNAGLWEMLPRALRTVASGVTFISPRMAGHILDEIQSIRHSPGKPNPPLPSH